MAVSAMIGGAPSPARNGIQAAFPQPGTRPLAPESKPGASFAGTGIEEPYLRKLSERRPSSSRYPN